MSRDDTTQEGPPLVDGRPSNLYAVLVEALEEAQRASTHLIGGVWRSPEDVVIAAHDACACWRIAEWTFRRAAVRVRLASAPPTNAAKDQLQQAANALDITRQTLNERLVAALVLPPTDDPAVRRELEQLQHDFAIVLPRGGADT